MPSIKKKYEDLTFTDDFMFTKVMQNNEKICKELVEIIIDRKIDRIVKIDREKAIKETLDGKGVRFDIFLEGEQEIYNIEMQNYNHKNLAKRARYYQGMIDVDYMEKGEDYKSLKIAI